MASLEEVYLSTHDNNGIAARPMLMGDYFMARLENTRRACLWPSVNGESPG